ncbi:hypothetical protein GSI_11271 [Ganoderma sinense ZZ0214-1]|uniref:Golgi apparatus membrane protein TVP38 n=1 Tax=Ganoderma sinense ZZ0214-1 TaxID=1077348 RepID=A0A2G8RYP9_9APHY|nr:hypothetical protein GSI_11271 [Ganoderma sinense ZZ0214-1]
MAAARSPYASSSPVRYANINANPSYPYPPDNGVDARSFESDSSNNRDRDSPHKRYVHAYGDGQPRAGFDDARAINRTPSPTPSEAKELQKGVFDWERMLSWRYWIRKEWIWYYLAFAISLAGIILFTVYHKQIVNWLMPAAHWMHALPFGWTIPIAVLFVISFPPLFGHEIVAIICGLVWGLGPGFGIVAAGTFLGELGNFYAFKYCCAARGEKLERTKLQYACLARVVRDGGFKIALIARLSAIPGHFTTAVFSTCGMSVITFSIAAILSLPKQFITVYLGVALEQSEDGKKSSKSDTIIKDVVLAATTIITIGAMWYIYHKMNQAKPLVIYDRRKARQAKLAAGAPYSSGSSPAMLESTVSVAFTPAASVSNVDIPLTKYGQPQPQGGIYAPQPRRAEQPGEQQYSMSQYDHSNPTLPPGAGYAYGMASAHTSYGRPSSPPSDPFSDSARVPNYSKPQTSAPAHSVSYQRQGPPHGYGSPPPDTWDRRAGPQSQSPQRMPSPPVIRHQPPSAPHTPTPRTYPAHHQHQQPPRSAPAPHDATNAHANPFSDPAPAPMPNPYDRAAGGHASEASDATFYTAAGAHSRGATFQTAYGHDGSDEGDGDGGAAAVQAHGLRTAPPAYSHAL